MAFLNLHSRFGRFVSALKIPFPGNGDFGSKRRGSNLPRASIASCRVEGCKATGHRKLATDKRLFWNALLQICRPSDPHYRLLIGLGTLRFMMMVPPPT